MPLRDEVMERAEARIGTVLDGKWRLDRVLGIGGMATVYAATHRNQKRVAIKMLHPEVSIDKQVTSRFTREGYVANTVGHPGTVSVLDDDVAEDGSAFLVMELIDGETLDTRWEKAGRLPAGEVLALADQLLDVLTAAHAKGILHRDLKPENLILTNDGQLKVLDFGIARLREMAVDQTAGSTRSGSLLGTPAFMAPEQARGRWQDVDERTDLWAVGATMYTLLSGRFVHEAETVNEQLIKTATTAAVTLARACPGLHERVVGLVDRALSYDRANRFPDARTFQQAVRDVVPFVPAWAKGAVGTSYATGGVPRETTTEIGTTSAAPAITNRTETLSTGRAFMSEVRVTPSRRAPVLVTAGAVIALLVAGAWLFARRGPTGVAILAQAGAPSAASAPPAAATPDVAAGMGLMVPENDNPSHEARDLPSAPTAELVVGNRMEPKGPKPGKLSKLVNGAPRAAGSTARPVAGPGATLPVEHGGDPFEKRH